VPRFRRRIALSTSLLALGLYFRLPDFFFATKDPPWACAAGGYSPDVSNSLVETW
jgi:hypothetical protein